MKRHITLSIISIALLCGCAKEIAPDIGNTIENNLDRITITLGERTRTDYSYEDQQLKTRWSKGDIVSVTPDLWRYFYAGEYEVENPGGSTSTFKSRERAIRWHISVHTTACARPSQTTAQSVSPGRTSLHV